MVLPPRVLCTGLLCTLLERLLPIVPGWLPTTADALLARSPPMGVDDTLRLCLRPAICRATRDRVAYFEGDAMLIGGEGGGGRGREEGNSTRQIVLLRNQDMTLYSSFGARRLHMPLTRLPNRCNARSRTSAR